MIKLSKLQAQRNAWRYFRRLRNEKKTRAKGKTNNRGMPRGGGRSEESKKVLSDQSTTDANGPSEIKEMEEAAKFAIDVYNITHLIKYKFVNVESVFKDVMSFNMTITARPADDDEKTPITFLAWVNYFCKYVKLVEIGRPPADLSSTDGLSFTRKNCFGSRDLARCDDKTRDILYEFAALALEAFIKKRRHMNFILVEVVSATGHLSAGSMVDLKFTARHICFYRGSTGLEHFRARVCFEHKNVAYVDIIDDYELTRFR